MSDTLITLIAILVSVILLFIFPVLNITVEHDKTVQSVIETLNCDYVENIAEQGIITLKDYEKFAKKVFATGYAYDITFEVKVLDENIAKKTDDQENAKYYSIFTDEILNNLQNEDYYLKQGDIITVTVENKTKTLGMQFKNFLYKVSNNEKKEIYSSCTLPISSNGIESINIAGKLSNKEYVVSIIGKIENEMLIHESKSYYPPYNLYICLDTSGSMADNSGGSSDSIDGGKSELAEAKRVTKKIIEQSYDKFDKNTIKIIEFNNSDSVTTVNSDEISGSNAEKKDKMIIALDSIKTKPADSSFNPLLKNIKEEIAKTDDSVIKNNFIIIFTDGIVSKETAVDPKVMFEDSKISLENIYSIIYNEEANNQYLKEIYKKSFGEEKGEKVYVWVHPIITMGVISGHISYSEVNVNPDYDKLKEIIDREKNGNREWNRCYLAGRDNIKIDFKKILEEIINIAKTMTQYEEKRCTNNKILTINKKNIEIDKEITISIKSEDSTSEGEMICSFILNDTTTYPTYISVEGDNLKIDCKGFRDVDEDEEITLTYTINKEMLLKNS